MSNGARRISNGRASPIVVFSSLTLLLMLTNCGIRQRRVVATSPPRARRTPTAVAAVTESSADPDPATAPAKRESASTPTATSSPEPSKTAVPSTATATSTPVPPTETFIPPTATAPPTASSTAAVLSFQASPGEVDPGDTVTLTWEAVGESATICPSARFHVLTSDDCREVDVVGTEAFVVPQEAASVSFIDFTLTVQTLAGTASETAQASVALNCQRTWFFSDEPQAGICPHEALHFPAAAQTFEQGRMIWVEQQPGRYYILEQAQVVAGDARKRLGVIYDPLEITGDTAAEIDPPEGLFAPESGFGLVWRGDVAQSEGYRDRLGWALKPEFGYETVFQCDNAQPSGGRSWQTCYLQGPDGRVIVLHPLGGWHYLGER